jgi:hypothetical protein
MNSQGMIQDGVKGKNTCSAATAVGLMGLMGATVVHFIRELARWRAGRKRTGCWIRAQAGMRERRGEERGSAEARERNGGGVCGVRS